MDITALLRVYHLFPNLLVHVWLISIIDRQTIDFWSLDQQELLYFLFLYNLDIPDLCVPSFINYRWNIQILLIIV